VSARSPSSCSSAAGLPRRAYVQAGRPGDRQHYSFERPATPYPAKDTPCFTLSSSRTPEAAIRCTHACQATVGLLTTEQLLTFQLADACWHPWQFDVCQMPAQRLHATSLCIPGPPLSPARASAGHPGAWTWPCGVHVVTGVRRRGRASGRAAGGPRVRCLVKQPLLGRALRPPASLPRGRGLAQVASVQPQLPGRAPACTAAPGPPRVPCRHGGSAGERGRWD